ncbi:MAG: hypothetical protein ABIO92_08505, partial [Chloroflexia bacterium]
GRHSKRFYSFATRWMVNEVNLHKLTNTPRPKLRNVARAYANARIGMLGMRFTARELERAPAGRGQIHIENTP